MNPYWRLCSSCKKEIGFSQIYHVCRVSTCNHKRSGMVFCSTSCWDAHLPLMRHREAWMEDRRAPSREAWLKQQAEEREDDVKPTQVSKTSTRECTVPSAPSNESELSDDILIVASKLKQYIRVRSGMNTSGDVMEILSDKVRELCNEAIRNAGRDGRKTVMARDF